MRLTLSTLPKIVQFQELTPLKNFYNPNNSRSIHQWKRTNLAIRTLKWTYTSNDLHGQTISLNNRAFGYAQCKNTITLPYIVRRSNYNNSKYALYGQPRPYSHCINFTNLSHRLISYYFSFLTGSFTSAHFIYLQLTNICLFKYNRFNIFQNPKPLAKPMLMFTTTLIL